MSLCLPPRPSLAKAQRFVRRTGRSTTRCRTTRGDDLRRALPSEGRDRERGDGPARVARYVADIGIGRPVFDGVSGAISSTANGDVVARRSPLAWCAAATRHLALIGTSPERPGPIGPGALCVRGRGGLTQRRRGAEKDRGRDTLRPSRHRRGIVRAGGLRAVQRRCFNPSQSQPVATPTLPRPDARARPPRPPLRRATHLECTPLRPRYDDARAAPALALLREAALPALRPAAVGARLSREALPAARRPLALRRAPPGARPGQRRAPGRGVDAVSTRRLADRLGWAGVDQGRGAEPHRLLQVAGAVHGRVAREGAGDRRGGPPLAGTRGAPPPPTPPPPGWRARRRPRDTPAPIVERCARSAPTGS